MSNNKKSGFNLTFPENLRKDANLSPTKKLSFDDLGDFIEEREKIKRATDEYLETELKIDYSNFENHVFFDSAVSKFDIAKKRVLDKYPYNGTLEQKDAHHLTSSHYEYYIFKQWPRHVGYIKLDGATQYISASDYDNKLVPTTSSLYVSAWVYPVVTDQNVILQVMSASVSPIKKHGYELYFSGATDPHLKLTVYSGSQKVSFSSSYVSYTGSFNNVSFVYDRPADLVSLYVNTQKVISGNLSYSSIEFRPTKLFVGSGSQFTANSSSYDYYSGSINEIRIFHTASEVLHFKNYNRPINAEPYVRLNYTFNEGVTETGSVDSVVVDYSKSGIHGSLLNYLSTARVSGSVMVNDFGNPILYSFHSRVTSFTSSYVLSASDYDKNNNNLIFNLIPEDIVKEDEDGLLTSFCLAMSRYFDSIKLYIDQFDNLRITNYDNANHTPDLMLPFLTKYFGWKITEHFGDVDPLSYFFGEGVLSSGSLEVPLIEIKNNFWRRTLNNLPYLLKTKGKRHNLDSFFNVLGVNRSNFTIKEFGYVPGTSIQDERISRDKPVALVGIGTGSFTGSYIKAPSVFPVDTILGTSYTVETLAQLPYVSASFTSSLITGSIWQFASNNHDDSITFLWNRPLQSSAGKFILTSSDGQSFSSDNVSVFDGNFVYLAAGLKSSGIPFIEVRVLDADSLSFSASFSGTLDFSMSFTGSDYDFVMGANSGSIFEHGTQGFFGEYRIWTRALTGSEMDDHTFNFQSIGIRDPQELPNPLKAHWALNENSSSDSSGVVFPVQDYSQNGFVATGSLFPANDNVYQKFLLNYNYLSPSLDLKWHDNKIRIRNKSQLTIDEVGVDTDEVSLEFNLVDSLNEDISKIFSSFDTLNQVIGSPVNKYRDEYADLENLRRIYFNRLSDSLNFTNFFKLFKWFDKKLSNSIKQLLPARVRFIGGEQVVESHFLERPKYQFKYPIFRTPKEIPENTISSSLYLSCSLQRSIHNYDQFAMGTYPHSVYEQNRGEMAPNLIVTSRPSAIAIDCMKSPKFVFNFGDGDENPDRLENNFFRRKLSGDEKDTINNPNVGVNYKNSVTRHTIQDRERRNIETITPNSGNFFMNPKLGNAFRFKVADSTKDQSHYFSSAVKHIRLAIRGLSSSFDSMTGSYFALTGSTTLELDQTLYDANNVLLNNSSFNDSVYSLNSTNVTELFNPELSVLVSASNTAFDVSDFSIEFKDDNSSDFTSYVDILSACSYIIETLDDNWKKIKYNFSDKSQPQITYDITNTHWRITCTTDNIYTFQDIKVEFDRELTNDGVKRYKEIDNTNNSKISSYVRRRIFSEI